MKKCLLLLCMLTMVLTSACSNEQDHTHSYTSEVTTAATCLSAGITTYSCTCGDSYTERILPTGHYWSDWECEITTLIGRIGTDIRTCAICEETQTQENFDDAAINSFLDYELQWLMWGDEPGVTNTENLLSYVSQNYEEREDYTINLASSTVFDYLSQRFVLTDDMKAEMKQDSRYNQDNDTFKLEYVSNFADVELLGYIHDGGDNYTAYYRLAYYGSDLTATWQVSLEFLLIDGKPNRYLSVVKVNSVPDNLITVTE